MVKSDTKETLYQSCDTTSEIIAKFDEGNHTYSNQVSEQLDGKLHNQQNLFERLFRNIENVQSHIQQSDVDNVHARGIDDGLAAIIKKVSLSAGQLRNAYKVYDAGADRYKIAEYFENAANAIADARAKLSFLEEFLEDEISQNESISHNLKTIQNTLDDIDTLFQNTQDEYKRTAKILQGEKN